MASSSRSDMGHTSYDPAGDLEPVRRTHEANKLAAGASSGRQGSC